MFKNGGYASFPCKPSDSQRAHLERNAPAYARIEWINEAAVQNGRDKIRTSVRATIDPDTIQDCLRFGHVLADFGTYAKKTTLAWQARWDSASWEPYVARCNMHLIRLNEKGLIQSLECICSSILGHTSEYLVRNIIKGLISAIHADDSLHMPELTYGNALKLGESFSIGGFSEGGMFLKRRNNDPKRYDQLVVHGDGPDQYWFCEITASEWSLHNETASSRHHLLPSLEHELKRQAEKQGSSAPAVRLMYILLSDTASVSMVTQEGLGECVVARIPFLEEALQLSEEALKRMGFENLIPILRNNNFDKNW